MKSLKRQTGWYNSAAAISLMAVVVLFIAQPWIPLMIAVAGAFCIGAIYLEKGVEKGGEYLHHYRELHHHH